jgi:hypothetical protein
MRINEVDNPVTQAEINQLEVFADRLFAKVGIDVEFTRHFLDRVNDERNVKQITMSELTRLFKQEYKRWGKPIAQLGPDAEAVMKDMATNINLPFALRWDHQNNELDLIAKTVMRKKDFKTSNKEFPIESIEEESEIHKLNKEDPNNPEVLIQGYGSLMLNQIEASVVRKLEELTKMAERGDFEQIQSLLNRDVMQTMMKAIVDTKAELQSIRRKGGAKSRGINKESILDIFNDDLDEKFDAVKKTVSETGGVGKIVPGINTTVDVGPDEIKKQAAKFGNAVDKDGVPKKTYRK